MTFPIKDHEIFNKFSRSFFYICYRKIYLCSKYMKRLMKFNLYTHILIALFTCFICFSCKDDEHYTPISLSYIGEGTSPLSDNNTMTISPFNEGEPFHINGGNGIYTINNHTPEKIDYRYDGNVLTIIPISLGDATLSITDRVGNNFILNVTVAYPNTILNVNEIYAIVTGGELTQNQAKEIENSIINRSLVEKGGKYIFTYTNQSLTEGLVSVYPSETSSTALLGIFKQDKRTIDEEGISIHITLTVGSSYDYLLTYHVPDNRTETYPTVYLQQDVTEDYKGLYPNLDRAYRIQTIPGESR